MRNAGASVDPPADPSGAASGAASAPPHKHPVRRVASLPRGVSALPRGVSADIFAEPPAPAAPAGSKPSGGGSLPPPAPPVEPWPVPDRAVREEPLVPSPTPVLLGPEPKGGTLRRALAGLTALLLVLYLVPAFAMSGEVLPGTTVLGVDIGGQSGTEAAATLRERLYADTRAPVIVRQGMRRLTVDPREAGLELDVEGTVGRAMTGFPSPWEVWGALTGSREVEPVVSVDRRRLDEAVATSVAAPLENPGREGGVSFEGVVPVATYPRAGRRIDREATADQIARAYLTPDAMVTVPTVLEQPRVGRAEVRRALRWARRAVAAPLTLTNGTASVSLPPATLARHLTFVPEGRLLRPRFDAGAAIAGVEQALVEPGRAARDASFTVRDGTPALVPGRPGDQVDTGRLAADVVAALDRGSRTVAVSVVNRPPRITDDAALRMGVREEVGGFTTSYTCCPQRAANIRAAAARLNGRLVRPGETFSFNEAVGPRTTAAGFDGVGPTLIHGRAGTDAAGMSQVATTMLNAVIRAGLRVAEHTPPEVHVAHLPVGTEAAVSFPEPDLRWKNDSPYGVLVQASAAGASLTVTLWSTKRYDVDLQGPVVGARVTLPAVVRQGTGCVPAPGQPGFTATVTRVLRRGGEVVSRQTFRTSYRARAEVVCASSKAASFGGARRDAARRSAATGARNGTNGTQKNGGQDVASGARNGTTGARNAATGGRNGAGGARSGAGSGAGGPGG